MWWLIKKTKELKEDFIVLNEAAFSIFEDWINGLEVMANNVFTSREAAA